MPVGKSILIIDDEANLRSTLAVILKRAGFFVTAACGSQEAILFLKASNFDLVFLDLKMPGMDGIQLLPEILYLRPNIPVIILTANASLEVAIRTLSMGACGYLLKPIDPEQIVDRVKDVLREQEQYRRSRELVDEIHDIFAGLKQVDV